MKPDCIQDLSDIERRIKDTADWLKKNGGNFSAEQRHLDEGSQERVYWHYGYLVALKDMMRFLTGETVPSRKSYKQDTTNSSPSS
jgi:hypothetical protein